MKILIIGWEVASAEPWLDAEPERLTNLRWLMEIGCYGRFENSTESAGVVAQTIGDQLANAGKRVRVIGAALATGRNQDEEMQQSRQRFAEARNLLPTAEWDCGVILERAPGSLSKIGNATSDSSADALRGYAERFDIELSELLAVGDDDTAIVIVSSGGAQSNFILAAPRCPLHGEIEGAQPMDLAPTLLELGGWSVPAALPGKSLIAGRLSSPTEETGYTDEEETLVRERLAGLGYI